MLKLNADPEATGEYHQKIKSLEEEIFFEKTKIKDMEMLWQDADSEHQDVMHEVSFIQNDNQFHDMSFGNELFMYEG